MKRLILLTISYPYRPNDIFLESEQPYFPKDIPIDAVPSGFTEQKTEMAVTLPDNVTLVPIAWKRVPLLSRLFYMAAALCRREVREDMRSLVKEKKAGARDVLSSLSWIARGDWLFHALEKHYRRELSEHPEELVFYSFWLLGPAYAAARLRAKYGCHAVARGNGGDIFEERSYMGRLPMRVFTLGNLDLVSVCSKDGQRYLEERYRTGDIRQAYLGSEDHGVRTVSPYSAEKPFVIASCGSVIPLKRIGLIAEAVGMLTGARVEWLHFGSGQLFDELKRSTASLPDNVTARLMGQTPHDQLMRFYADNDIHLFISASTTETTPVSIMEALSFGIPVLATDAGGSRETLTPSHGLLLPVDITARQLSEGIQSFLDMPWEKYLDMRRGARDYWERNFSASVNYTEFYDMLGRL